MSDRLAPEQADSLPGVPEPAETTDLFGHRGELAALAEEYRRGALHHALLFGGPQGIGKATTAFHLAHHLLAHPVASVAPAQPPPSIDAASSLHRMIASGAHPAVLHLTRPYDEKRKVFRTGITVDEIKRVNRFLGMTSHDGSYRIVIVDPADDMNRNAANALLKNLEEPPRRTLFILIAHQPGRLLPTIRSRCRVIRFHPLADDDLRAAVAASGHEIPSGDLVAAGGSPREALLLSAHGGSEIIGAIGSIVAGNRFDVRAAQKVADAVAGRESAIQFRIFNRAVLDLVAARAADAACRGGRGADRVAAFWQEAERQVEETDAYNLDKRQHVVSLLERAREVLER